MDVISKILVAVVALEHLYFLYLEMFAWTQPRTRRAFGTTAEFAEESKTMAANQGLYNGFLAAGLLWGIVHPNPATGHQIDLFFLICVIVAGVYGGLTVKRSILLIQGLPALVALVVLLASGL
jgi:putative membrane protein